jgi:predicted nucleotidyltransferase
MSQTVESTTDVFALLRKNRDVVRSFGVERIGVFGSFAGESVDASSDVDVLVRFDPERKSFDRFLALTDYLEEIFDRPVELVTTKALSPHNRERILEEVRYVDLTG